MSTLIQYCIWLNLITYRHNTLKLPVYYFSDKLANARSAASSSRIWPLALVVAVAGPALAFSAVAELFDENQLPAVPAAVCWFPVDCTFAAAFSGGLAAEDTIPGAALLTKAKRLASSALLSSVRPRDAPLPVVAALRSGCLSVAAVHCSISGSSRPSLDNAESTSSPSFVRKEA